MQRDERFVRVLIEAGQSSQCAFVAGPKTGHKVDACESDTDMLHSHHDLNHDAAALTPATEMLAIAGSSDGAGLAMVLEQPDE
jgi:hypothetical protein